MTIKSYNIDNNIAQKFKENTPKQKTSQKIQELMEEHLKQENVDIEKERQTQAETTTILDNDVLTQKQKALANMIIEDKLAGEPKSVIKKNSEKKGIYSKKQHFKDNLKVLLNLSDFPVKGTNTGTRPGQVECGGCGVSVNVKGLASDKADMSCPNCGQGYSLV